MTTVAHPTSRWLGRRVLFHAGPLPVSSYVAMLYVGCVLGTYAGAAVAGADGLDHTRFVVATVVLMIPALVGARLLFVVQHWSDFRGGARRLWSRAEGGAAMYGGLLLMVPASLLVLDIADMPFWSFWDASSVTILVGMVFTRVGCTMNGCCCGRSTDGRFGRWMPDHRGEWRRRYPTQPWEAALGASVLTLALLVRTRLTVEGVLFGVVVVAYTSGRLVLQRFRENGTERAQIATWCKRPRGTRP